MEHYHYATVSEAVNELKKRGFTTDFNLEENCIVCHVDKFTPENFEITEVYRYEGNTDPADEATVYGIESKTGLKGILVTGYGAYTENMSVAIIEKLKIRND